ncbi:hypothetical protein [Paenibacillus sp. IHBB 10380]|uniref:hypothetical protein n=1 Tax=Paenibacillus sp. IHBB 10380 TaxID=1566358 RepID=UPI0005CFB2BC|nr:hypothetical protein [Paenibacillus sp. IHBB 10380]AJS58798.1 hypothetical protein UB51_10270 [Paenibacillus sp. IHBB 10380]
MNVHIESADMKKNEDGHFIGHTLFSIEGYKDSYELTFFSKRGKEWDYSINFAKESGKEEDLLTIDKLIEEDDDLFDQLLDAALDSMEPTASE